MLSPVSAKTDDESQSIGQYSSTSRPTDDCIPIANSTFVTCRQFAPTEPTILHILSFSLQYSPNHSFDSSSQDTSNITPDSITIIETHEPQSPAWRGTYSRQDDCAA